ncbi:MAG: CheR family methyltransferase [Chloroflexota bacterium]
MQRMAYLYESIPLTETVFTLLSRLLLERLGLSYGPEKRDLVQDRLAPLLAERGLTSFVDYYYLLKYDEHNSQEWLLVQTALAVRETYFWREVDQVLLAANQLVPELQSQAAGRPVRIWHAACASGEEPYSMAIALDQAGCFARGPIEIIGVDFDSHSLRLARQGCYGERAFRALPPDLRRRYFMPGSGCSQLVDDIRSRVSFQYLNLAQWNGAVMPGSFDIIFCRNVFIYFDETTIQRVAQNFYQALRTPGYLFLGAAESLMRVSTAFELIERSKCFVYTR